jgi:hypothetical protein
MPTTWYANKRATNCRRELDRTGTAGQVNGINRDRNQRKERVMSPEDGGPLTFEKDIKPLFRTKDREAMAAIFDLWSYRDVTEHANAILSQLRAGSMPCDGPWPTDRTDLFETWIGMGRLS